MPPFSVYPRATTTPTPSPSSSAAPEPVTSDIRVGGIPLPVFIVLIMFGPFFISFFGFICYTYFVKKPADRKMLANQEKLEADRQAHVQEQMRALQLQRVRPISLDEAIELQEYPPPRPVPAQKRRARLNEPRYFSEV